MLLERLGVEEGFSAHLADEGADPRVDLHVVLERVRVRVGFSAGGAHEGLLPAVRQQVALQVGRVAERAAALRALVAGGPPRRGLVQSLVSNQRARPQVPGSALVTHVRLGPPHHHHPRW